MNPRVETSPSGRYTLTISSVETQPGCWKYTMGIVHRTLSDGGNLDLLARVDRNYSSFPFLWIEDHPNGHDYLVCGADYQGQTVIELGTRADVAPPEPCALRRDFLPEEAKQGHGFCWVEYKFDREAQVLVANGCIWAAPFEYRFYDFSDPMNGGWPEISLPDNCIYDEGVEPIFQSDGTILCFEQREDEDTEEKSVVATQTYRREGLRLVLVSEWVDDAEKVRRAEAAARKLAYEAAWEEYKQTDPLYLLVATRRAADGFLDDYIGVGVTYDGWCPDFSGREGRICCRLADKKSHGVVIDLEWGRKTAPIKLIVWPDDGQPTPRWFPHSVEGMAEAFDAAKAALPKEKT